MVKPVSKVFSTSLKNLFVWNLLSFGLTVALTFGAEPAKGKLPSAMLGAGLNQLEQKPTPGTLEQSPEFAVARDLSTAIRWASNRLRSAIVSIPVDKGERYGAVIDSDGYIAISHRLIAGKTTVSLKHNGRPYTGRVIASDPSGESALIKIDAKNLSHVALGDADSLGVGDWVCAITSPQDFPLWTATGIVVAAKRSGAGGGSVLQTTIYSDAKCLGSPVVNLKGELVGFISSVPRPGVTLVAGSKLLSQLLSKAKSAGSQK